MTQHFSPQYESLQWRAHRRQGAIVEAPAIAWHRVFWRQEYDKFNDGVPILENKERAEISAFLIKIIRALDNPQTPANGPLTLFDGSSYDVGTGQIAPKTSGAQPGKRPDTINFRGTFRGIKIRCRAGIYSENWIITIYVEISSFRGICNDDEEISNPAEQFFKNFVKLESKLNAIYETRFKHDGVSPAGASDDFDIRRKLLSDARESLADSVESSYYKIWEFFSIELNLTNNSFEDKKIADFRGLILFDSSIFPFTGRIGSDGKYVFPNLFKTDGPRRRHGILNPGAQKYKETSSAIVNYVWPLITAPHPVDFDDH